MYVCSNLLGDIISNRRISPSDKPMNTYAPSSVVSMVVTSPIDPSQMNDLLICSRDNDGRGE